jgi:hypothetical protein
MRHAALALAASLSFATPLAGAPPEGVTNARVESRSAASGLAATMKAEMASRPAPLWIGWAVPAQGDQSACCWSSAKDAGHGRGGCRLEGRGDGGVFRHEGDAVVSLEGRPRVRVLVRAEAGRVRRVQAYSEDCALDAGGLEFLWLEDVRPAESVAFLATFAASLPARDDDELEHGALAAIAFHADPTADSALERFVHPREPLDRRRQAAFWLGQARGERGYALLSRMVREDADADFREHAVFALRQSREPGAVDRIIEVARKDPSAGVRGQALFWLAQAAARRAPPVIKAALDADPDVEVKKQAVFALSQLPRDECPPIGLARPTRAAKSGSRRCSGWARAATLARWPSSRTCCGGSVGQRSDSSRATWPSCVGGPS